LSYLVLDKWTSVATRRIELHVVALGVRSVPLETARHPDNFSVGRIAQYRLLEMRFRLLNDRPLVLKLEPGGRPGRLAGETPI